MFFSIKYDIICLTALPNSKTDVITTEREFYTISVYVDKDENLIGIPCGESEQYGIADIDTVLVLKAPYTEEQAEQFIEQVFDACYTKSTTTQTRFPPLKDTQRKRALWLPQAS